jgi:hypothetical protein
MSSQDRDRDIISARREAVFQAYNSAKADNHVRYLEGYDKATAEYIFQNQREDAMTIVDKFYKDNRRVISVQKKTKVGADGLMIEIIKLLTTHIDDSFVVNPANVRIITGMSNASWEKDMIEKSPICFKDKIFHHGKLSHADLASIKNGLIIIDEIDTGDKEFQVLHNTLASAGVLNVHNMRQHNNRFVFISATMIRELYDLYRWGPLHDLHIMTIPPSYIGHKDFLERGIIREFYPIDTLEDAERWIQEDIIDNYGSDYRVHIIRVNTKANTTYAIQNACIRKGIVFKNHTSTDRLTDTEIKEFFKEPLSQHIVLGVKGFYRRANLIPDRWKLRIGATHELYTRTVDNNTQIQALPGRMSGYWRDKIEAGHKTGPHRTSIKAIEEYEKIYNDPFGNNSYQTAGFKKNRGRVFAEPTMLSPKHIDNLETVELPEAKGITKSHLEEFSSMEELNRRWKEVNPGATSDLREPRKEDGRYMCSVGEKSQEYNISEIRNRVGGTSMAYWGEGYTTAKKGDIIHRIYVGYNNDDTPVFALRWAIKATDGPVRGSQPIVIVNIRDDEISRFDDTAAMLLVIKKYREDIYNKYKSYEPHCLKINNEIKRRKYGLNAMLESDAHSSKPYNMDGTKNMLMIYLYEKRMIISPWNGEATGGGSRSGGGSNTH